MMFIHTHFKAYHLQRFKGLDNPIQSNRLNMFMTNNISKAILMLAFLDVVNSMNVTINNTDFENSNQDNSQHTIHPIVFASLVLVVFF